MEPARNITARTVHSLPMGLDRALPSRQPTIPPLTDSGGGEERQAVSDYPNVLSTSPQRSTFCLGL